MIKLLEFFCSSKKAVAIFADRTDISKFLYGIIMAVDEEMCAISSISLNGDYDGVVIVKIDDIIRIDIGGQYQYKMSCLCSEKAHDCFPICFDNENILNSIMRFSENNHVIVSIELINSGFDDVVGFVEEITDDVCKIHLVDEYGNDDGQSFIPLFNISKLCLDSSKERRISKLYKRNKNTNNDNTNTKGSSSCVS